MWCMHSAPLIPVTLFFVGCIYATKYVSLGAVLEAFLQEMHNDVNFIIMQLLL